MDEILYNALSRYYHALEVKGYMPIIQAYKLLVLIFYKDFVYSDYRGIITEKDYMLIEKVLDCLYGTTCLIPYPDYLKMGKLYLGEITEIAHRVTALEDTPVLKLIRDLSSAEGNVDTDIMVMADGVTGTDPDDPNNYTGNGNSDSINNGNSSGGNTVHTGDNENSKENLVYYLNKRTS